ncbi:MAG TPA: hypothetical protein VFW87_10335, partial [Pirellulales bacterium]|nr:hypothetical protein [Pirellulales bacterium]
LLVGNGTLDAAELIGQIRGGRIHWLFLHQPIEAHLQAVDRQSNLWPPEVLRCLEEHFQSVASPDGLFVYRRQQPRPS